MKMEVQIASETLVTIYQYSRCHIPLNQFLNQVSELHMLHENKLKICAHLPRNERGEYSLAE
jgi:hypothetical protein